MNTVRSLRSHAAIVAALFLAIATPVMAEKDNGWSWGKGAMGHWFWGEMMGPDMMDGWGPGMMMGRRCNEVRLNALKDELAITEARKKLWDDYVAAVKNAVTAVRGVHVTIMDGDVPAILPKRIKLHEGIMSGRFDAMKSTDAATLALYNGLDDAQERRPMSLS